jgi:predicted DNA-binding transcriptional regulator YafY
MRASRLLHILLLLQNRGRMTAPALAAELEVHPRTIQRDIDALTEAGLPVITHRGAAGGVELGFNYRTRLTGLAEDEAEALTLWLSAPPPALHALGLAEAARRAKAKFLESLPDRSRAIVAQTASRFPLQPATDSTPDPRIPAIAEAIRLGRTLTLAARSSAPLRLRPAQLGFGPTGWWVMGPPLSTPVPQAEWGDINISRLPVDITPRPAYEAPG